VSDRAPVSPSERQDELAVAELVATHGLQGELKARPLTDFPEALSRLDSVVLEGKTGRRAARLLSVRGQGTTLIFRIEGIDSIDAAEMLRGFLVKIPLSEAHPLPEGHYYIADIIGLDVFTEDGRSLGRIRDVFRTGSNDVYQADVALIPATREAVTVLDVPGRRMVVNSALIVE